jgi:hypothetical protein
MSDVLIVSNYFLGDVTFDSDRGSWNVTRAQHDFFAGKHTVYGDFDIDETVAQSCNVSVDEDKIAEMVAHPEALIDSPPLIFVEEGQSEDGRPVIWLIDGHHRVRALQQLGFTRCAAYVIEEKDAAPYRMFFNGERIAPWMRRKA